MTLFVFGLVGLIILGLTKRMNFTAMTPVPVHVSMVSSVRSCSQCGAGLQDQMDALFPERRASQTHYVTKKSDGNIPKQPALDGYPQPIHSAFSWVGAMVGFIASWLWVRWRGDII